MMKLIFSEPVVVAAGPDSREAGWGPYQFPALYRLADGRIVYTFNTGADNATEYGFELGCCVSEDNGATWQRARERDFYTQTGVLLPNGDRVRFDEPMSIPLEGLTLPEPIGVSGLKKHTVHLLEQVDPAICWKGWRMVRIHDGKAEEEEVTLNWKNRFVISTGQVLIPPMARGRLRLAPDGALWMPDYNSAGVDPEKGFVSPYHCNYTARSVDNGRTWELMHFMPFDPEYFEDPEAARWEGFNENDIGFMPDGSMIRLVRTFGQKGRSALMQIVRSEDGGHTWTKPETFSDHGVWPCLLTLECGVTLASYGRPGLAIRATEDPSGRVWEDPIEMFDLTTISKEAGVKMLERGTCGYSDMIPLSENTAALAYSDFTVKDDHGIPRKTMMFRTITVEK